MGSTTAMLPSPPPSSSQVGSQPSAPSSNMNTFRAVEHPTRGSGSFPLGRGACVCVCVCVWVGGGGLRVAHATRIPGATSPHVGVAIGLTAGPCVGGLTPPRLAPVVQMSSSHPPPTPPAPPAKGRGTQPHAARMHRGNGQGVGGSMPLAAIVCAAPPISQLGKSRGFAKCC